MTAEPNRLLAAVDKLTRPYKVGTEVPEQHEHSWRPCRGHHGDGNGGEVACADWWAPRIRGVASERDRRRRALELATRCQLLVCEFCGETVKPPAPQPSMRTRWTYEDHPPLLELLTTVNGSPGNSPSSDPGVPIDQEATRIIRDITAELRSWCEALEFQNSYRDVPSAIRRWYQVHTEALRSNQLTEVADRAVTSAVEGWVRRIEEKFDPPQVLEWTDRCPGWRAVFDDGGEVVGRRRCRARRVTVKNETTGVSEVRFAIHVNLSALEARCVACGTEWRGDRGLRQLRYETNLMLLEEEQQRERDDDFLQQTAGGVSQPDVAEDPPVSS